MHLALRQRLTYANVMATIAAFLALGGGGYAIAASGGGGGVIRACVTHAGTVRLVGAGTRCGRGQHVVSWNQQGPRGLRGLQGTQGIQGIQGFQGGQGVQGVPGPTFGAAAMSGGDPSASPDMTSATATSDHMHVDFTLPSAGRVYISFFSAAMGADCSAGGPTAGLYLDNVPLPGTSHNLGSAIAGGPHQLVAVATVSAGQHAAEVRYDCPTGDLSALEVDGAPAWTVLLLGS